MKNFNQSNDNLMVEMLAKETKSEGEAKLERQIVKMQFMSEMDCKEFEKFVENYFGK